ncbi:MAG: hypothetical protein KDB83_02305 [Actinobacteria bacterium]|jgi:hypothetical protein|nr:hypothetical protein [Actinomycetota bacterium]TXH40362.1 MAG: hypothetical protein E6Q90_14170 [Actinomycetota bacterium]HRY09669.1 hypothetical protein [Candidatus Nanopelagicales bacterium]
MTSWKIVVVACCALVLAGVTPAAAKSGPKTGTYRSTGDIEFRFTVTKEQCRLPKGKLVNGFCLSGIDKPQAPVDCPDGEGYQPDYSDYPSFPYLARIPKNGKVNWSSTTFFASGDEAGKNYFSIKIKRNGTAKGWVRLDRVSTWGIPTTCSTGKLNFTAKRS